MKEQIRILLGAVVLWSAAMGWNGPLEAAPQNLATELRECQQQRDSLRNQIAGFKADVVALRNQIATLSVDVLKTTAQPTQSIELPSVAMELDVQQLSLSLKTEVVKFENQFRKEMGDLRDMNKSQIEKLAKAQASIDSLTDEVRQLNEKTAQLQSTFSQDLKQKIADLDRMRSRKEFLEGELRKLGADLQNLSGSVVKFDSTRIECRTQRCGDTLRLSGSEKKVITGFHLTVSDTLGRLSQEAQRTSEDAQPEPAPGGGR